MGWQICQAVLDTAVLKIGAAKLPGQKRAQAAALVEHYTERDQYQHRRHGQQGRLRQGHRHDHRGDGDQQQKQQSGNIQSILVFHRTLPCSGKQLHFQQNWQDHGAALGAAVDIARQRLAHAGFDAGPVVQVVGQAAVQGISTWVRAPSISSSLSRT